MPAHFKAIATLCVSVLIAPSAWRHVDASEDRTRIHAPIQEEINRFLSTRDFGILMTITQSWQDGYSEDEQKQLIIELLKRLTNPREIGLTNYSSLCIYSRANTQTPYREQRTMVVYQDLFLENGRCAWGIQRMLNCQLPHFTEEVGRDKSLLSRYAQEACYAVITAMVLPKPTAKAQPEFESEIRKKLRKLKEGPTPTPRTNN